MSSDDDNNNDLTRIEDLSEFLHSENEEEFESLEDIALRSEESNNKDNDFLSDSDEEDFVANQDEDDFSFNDAKESESSESSFQDDSEGFSDMNTSPDLAFNQNDLVDDNDEDEFQSNSFLTESSDETEADSFESDEFTNFNSDIDTEQDDTNEFESTFETLDEENESIEDESENLFSEAPDLDIPQETNSFDAEEIEEIEEIEESEIADTYEPTSELIVQEDLAEEFDEQPPQIKTEIPQIKEEPSPVVQDFEEVKVFASTMSLGSAAAEGNPPFSIILNKIKYYEDIEPIAQILIEHSIIDEASKSDVVSSLKNGRFLIPRLSEYAAILLCHKFRMFDLEILMGLTEEISPPKSYESNDRGLSYKKSIFSNKKDEFNLSTLKPIDISVTTLPIMEGHQITQYIGIVNQSLKLDASDLSKDNESIDKYYTELTAELKKMAIDKGANGIVGVTFQTNPLPDNQYQLMATGNLVWHEKTK